MSLNQLSPELCHMVIELLPIADRCSLALTSKHYVELLFSSFHNRVYITKRNETALSKLVHKLVIDPDLRDKIRGIDFMESHDAEWREDTDEVELGVKFPDYSPADMRQLLKIVQETRPKILANAVKILVMDVIAGQWDAMVAVVLGLTKKVEEVRLRTRTDTEHLENLFINRDLLPALAHFDFQYRRSTGIPAIVIPATKSIRTLFARNVLLRDVNPLDLSAVKELKLFGTRFGAGAGPSSQVVQGRLDQLESLQIYDTGLFDGNEWCMISGRLNTAAKLKTLDIRGNQCVTAHTQFRQGLIQVCSLGQIRFLGISVHQIANHPSTAGDLLEIVPQSIEVLKVYVVNKQNYWKTFMRGMKQLKENYDKSNFLNLMSISICFVQPADENVQLANMVSDIGVLKNDWVGSKVCFEAVRSVPGQAQANLLM